ncbi:MAG: hypothetical protein R3322_08890 [Kiloniellales bacterium]|nr:hypothetical protein [Kiloniellales bacterium]
MTKKPEDELWGWAEIAHAVNRTERHIRRHRDVLFTYVERRQHPSGPWMAWTINQSCTPIRRQLDGTASAAHSEAGRLGNLARWSATACSTPF